MGNLKTYWTVRAAVMGGNTKDLFFKRYENAKAESLKDYRDKPIKHTVTMEKYTALEDAGAFLDMAYILQYYLPSQSEFSEPQYYMTDSEAEYNRALRIAKEKKYKVILSGKFPVNHREKVIYVQEK